LIQADRLQADVPKSTIEHLLFVIGKPPRLDDFLKSSRRLNRVRRAEARGWWLP
jgi:hypothetical protein